MVASLPVSILSCQKENMRKELTSGYLHTNTRTAVGIMPTMKKSSSWRGKEKHRQRNNPSNSGHPVRIHWHSKTAWMKQATSDKEPKDDPYGWLTSGTPIQVSEHSSPVQRPNVELTKNCNVRPYSQRVSYFSIAHCQWRPLQRLSLTGYSGRWYHKLGPRWSAIQSGGDVHILTLSQKIISTADIPSRGSLA